MNAGLQNAIFSGCCAALVSVFGKYMGMSELHLALRAVCAALLVLFTMFMIGFMTKSMQTLSTLTATIANTTSNFIITVWQQIVIFIFCAQALCSFLLFHEQVTRNWFFGTCLIVTGLVLILRAEPENNEQKKRA